jgi:hypothetical protein
MVAEATLQNREPGIHLPAGIYRRQAWRPAGLHGVDSILSGIASRTKLATGHRARLIAWYEQFVHRSQPFVGWQPLATAELEAHDRQYPFGSTPAEERILRRESPMSSQELPSVARPVSAAQDQGSGTHLRRFPAEQQRPQEPSASHRSISEPIHTTAKSEQLSGDLSGPRERPMEAAVQLLAPRARRETADNRAGQASSSDVSQLPAKDASQSTEAGGPEQPLVAPTRRREEQPLERPPLRLAILRPINRVAGTVQRKELGPLSSGSAFSMTETKDLRSPEHSLGEEQSAFPPRLIQSISSLQPQDVRGGFPLDVKTQVRRDADTSSDDLGVRDLSAFRDDGVKSRSLAISRQAAISEPAAGPSADLPGVQIRLLKPHEWAPATQPPGNNIADGGRSTSERKPQTPVPAAPPPLDINAVADKVYQALQRRFQFERERRGIY